jgi:DNA-binding response OmpR family regulator
MRLLLVEDSPRLGPLLIESLRAAGYLVDLATTAQDFLHLVGVNSTRCISSTWASPTTTASA